MDDSQRFAHRQRLHAKLIRLAASGAKYPKPVRVTREEAAAWLEWERELIAAAESRLREDLGMEGKEAA